MDARTGERTREYNAQRAPDPLGVARDPLALWEWTGAPNGG